MSGVPFRSPVITTPFVSTLIESVCNDWIWASFLRRCFLPLVPRLFRLLVKFGELLRVGNEAVEVKLRFWPLRELQKLVHSLAFPLYL